MVWYGTWKEGCVQHCLCTCSCIFPSASTSRDHQCLNLPLLLSSPFSSQFSHFLQTVSLCLSHLLLFYSLDSWLPAHASWLCLQLNPRFPCPFSAKRPLSMEKTQQLLFIFISYNRGKVLASLWELAALFPPLLPSQKSGFPTYCWGHS